MEEGRGCSPGKHSWIPASCWLSKAPPRRSCLNPGEEKEVEDTRDGLSQRQCWGMHGSPCTAHPPQIPWTLHPRTPARPCHCEPCTARA